MVKIGGNTPYIYNLEAIEGKGLSTAQENIGLFPYQNENLLQYHPDVKKNEKIVTEDGKTIITERNQEGVVVKEQIIEKNGNKKIVEYKNGEPYRTTNFTKGGQIKEVVSIINGHELREVVDDTTMMKTTFIDGKQIKSEKTGDTIAETLYESMKGLGTGSNFDKTIKQINKDNIYEVLEQFSELSPDESLAQWIMNEGGRGSICNTQDVKFLYEQLKQRAQEYGIDTKQFDEKFNNASCFEYGTNNAKDVDYVFDTLLQVISAHENITDEDKDKINDLTYVKSGGVFEKEIKKVETEYTQYINEKGWAGEVTDFLLEMLGSEYSEQNMNAKLQICEKELEILSSSKTEEEFKANFKEVFGVEYDSTLVFNLAKKETNLFDASAASETINLMKEAGEDFLIFDKDLALEEEYRFKYSVPSEAIIGFVDEQSVDPVITTKKYERAEAKLVEFFAEHLYEGDKTIAKKIINEQFEQSGLNEQSSVYEKFEAMQKFCTKFIEGQETVIMNKTEGLGLEQYEEDVVLPAYAATFGTKSDLPKLIYDGIKVRNKNSEDLKTCVKYATVAGVVASGGSLATVAGVAGAANFIVDVSDAAVSNEGLQEGELAEITMNSALTTGVTFLVGGVCHQIHIHGMNEHNVVTAAEQEVHHLIHPHVDHTLFKPIDFNIAM